MPVRFVGGPLDGERALVPGYGVLVSRGAGEPMWYVMDWRAGDTPDGFMPFRPA